MLKTVVIVGASKGIGAELMESFASIDGFRVFGFARNMQLQREKWSLNPHVHCLDIDLTSENLQLQILDVLKYKFISHVPGGIIVSGNAPGTDVKEPIR